MFGMFSNRANETVSDKFHTVVRTHNTYATYHAQDLFFSGGIQTMTQFKPGQSGNPLGKPKGAKSRYTLMREALADDLPALLEATKAAALAGDMGAMRLLLERTLPTHKAVSPPVSVPELEQAETLADRARAILNATSRADLPPDIAAQLLGALGNLAKLIEIDEIERRLAALEQKQ